MVDGETERGAVSAGLATRDDHLWNSVHARFKVKKFPAKGGTQHTWHRS
jgi:hypothetical protein